MVVAATQSAMLDETVVDQPNDFRIDRLPYIYMHWGYRLHTCFGQYSIRRKFLEYSSRCCSAIRYGARLVMPAN